MWGKILLGAELFLAFGGLFWWIRRESIIHNGLRQAKSMLSRQKNLMNRLDKILLYSSLYRIIPWLTPENFILAQLFGIGLVCLGVSLFGLSPWIGIVFVCGFAGIQYGIISILIGRNYSATDENLLKFLDFMGNYSITSGEVTSVLYQVSGYLDEPLRSALEECYYEAQTFGNTSAALLGMTEKIQHPKFGEIVRNIEVTMRYSADFTILVSQSRRSVREHMRMRQERKSLAREAAVNMLILGVMTVIILKIVESLINVSVREVLLHSWVGRGFLIGIGMILLLFYRQVRRIDK